MKIRLCFISNSSSSSFVILRKDLNEDQIWGLRNYKQLAKAMGIYGARMEDWIEDWQCYETENKFTFQTQDSSCQLDQLFDMMKISYTKEDM